MRPYHLRVGAEIETYSAIEHVHDLPQIAHYWSHKYLIPMLEPFGFTNAPEFFRNYIARICGDLSSETVPVLSIGAGDCATEINIAVWLRENGTDNFSFECLDINPGVLERAVSSAQQSGVHEHFTFKTFDVNSWRPDREYRVILAIHSLHHILELETLFEKIHQALHADGFFMTDDMIGRNGHQRWPEALKFVEELWTELPARYKYNHSLKRMDEKFENWDCSVAGFEGIRAQDILPLLVQKFHFDLFVGWGNIIDIFIDRSFGPNFDPKSEWDRAFIDRVQALDVAELENGRVKPTHIIASMSKKPVARTRVHKQFTPEFCVRWPDSPQSISHGVWKRIFAVRNPH